MAINILCIGDVVGRAGRSVLADHLPQFIKDREVDFVVCNAENIAGGSGITPQLFKKLINYGVDVITLGDHVYRKKEIVSTLETSDRIVRPANLSRAAAGKRWTAVTTKSGMRQAAVACVLGQLYMKPIDSPWQAIEDILTEIPQDIKIRIVDMHAEASSEKIAMGWFLNGRASIVFGTHTHIPTADACILDKGTAYISDLGMTGPYDGVLGRRKDRVLSALTTSMPVSFTVARGDPRMCGILVGVNATTGRAESIERIEIKGEVKEGGPYDHEDGKAQKNDRA